MAIIIRKYVQAFCFYLLKKPIELKERGKDSPSCHKSKHKTSSKFNFAALGLKRYVALTTSTDFQGLGQNQGSLLSGKIVHDYNLK